MKQLSIDIKDYFIKNRGKLISYFFVILMALSAFAYFKSIKFPIVINRTTTVTAENVEVVKDIYFINLITVDKSQKLSEYFSYKPNTYFNDQIYWKSYITFIKSRDTDAGFYMITNYPVPQNMEISLYYIVMMNGNFQHGKDYIQMIYPIFSVHDPIPSISI